MGQRRVRRVCSVCIVADLLPELFLLRLRPPIDWPQLHDAKLLPLVRVLRACLLRQPTSRPTARTVRQTVDACFKHV